MNRSALSGLVILIVIGFEAKDANGQYYDQKDDDAGQDEEDYDHLWRRCR